MIGEPTGLTPEARTLVDELATSWRIGKNTVKTRVIPAVAAALADGWSVEQIRDEVTRERPGTIRNPALVMAARLEDLPRPPAAVVRRAAPEKQCSDPLHDPNDPLGKRMLDDPKTGPRPCPKCHPKFFIANGAQS